MIWTIYAVFCTIGLFLVFLGAYDKRPELQIIGWVTFFFLSLSFYNAGIDYSVGQNDVMSIVETIIGNASSYNITNTNSFSYDTYTSKSMAIWHMILSMLGVISVLFDLKKTSPADR